MKIKFIIGGIFLIMIFISTISGLVWLKKTKKEIEYLKSLTAETISLVKEYKSLKSIIDKIEIKLLEENVSSFTEDIRKAMAIKGLSNRFEIKLISTEESLFGFRETGEVILKKITMNELINILYYFEKERATITINSISIKKSSQNPNLFDVKMELSVTKIKKSSESPSEPSEELL